MGILFLILIFLYLIHIELVMITAKIFRPKFYKRRLTGWVHTWCKALIGIAVRVLKLGVEVDLRSAGELPQRAIVLSNHQSLIDIIALLANFDDRRLLFVSKKSLGKRIPGASRVLRTQRHALIDRKYNLIQTARELRSLSHRAARANASIAIFPEGTRAKDGVLGQFNSGAYRVVQMTSPLPVIVTAVDGGYKLSHFSSFSPKNTGVYRARVLAVLPAPASKQEIAETLETSRRLIAEQLAKWRAEPVKKA